MPEYTSRSASQLAADGPLLADEHAIDPHASAASRRGQSDDIRQALRDEPADGPTRQAAASAGDRDEGAPAEPQFLELGGGTHTVPPGGNLWRIAEEIYGDGSLYVLLRDANPDDVHDGGRLVYAGAVLDVPRIARPMLDGLAAFSDDPERQLDVVSGVSQEDYAAFIAGLTAEEADANAEMLQTLEMMRASGMTLDQLAEDQQRWMETRAAAEGLSIGGFIQQETAARGYGGATATWWPSLTPDEQRAWTARFEAAVAAVEAAAPDDIRAILDEATANGGGFAWEPQVCEELGAFAFNNGRHALGVGRAWVEAVETDPAVTFGNVAHELSGHQEYGDTVGWAIISRVLANLPADEQALARGGANHIFSAYGYMETEVFAELREQEHLHPDNPTDTPAQDVPRQLQRIADAFSPTVADAIVRGLWRRVESSPHMTDEARQLFVEQVRAVFGIAL